MPTPPEDLNADGNLVSNEAFAEYMAPIEDRERLEIQIADVIADEVRGRAARVHERAAMELADAVRDALPP